MTKSEIETIENIVARLRKPNAGCSVNPGHRELAEQANAKGLQLVSTIYLETWVIGALECLLPGEGRDPKLAVSLSR